MAEERTGVCTFKGEALTLIGPEIKVGDKAPDFKVSKGFEEQVTLASSAGKTRLISVVPSLDTPVCEEQTVRFNKEASNLPDNVAVLTISLDLPPAQSRFCGAKNVDKIEVLSDHKEASFAQAYGVLIKELRLASRAIFVVGSDDSVKYVEYVKEVVDHPDYDKALNAARAAAG